MGNEQVVDSLHGEALDFSLYLKSATQGSIHSPREETLDEHSFHPEKVLGFRFSDGEVSSSTPCSPTPKSTRTRISSQESWRL